jgi:hypothetical protein
VKGAPPSRGVTGWVGAGVCREVAELSRKLLKRVGRTSLKEQLMKHFSIKSRSKSRSKFSSASFATHDPVKFDFDLEYYNIQVSRAARVPGLPAVVNGKGACWAGQEARVPTSSHLLVDWSQFAARQGCRMQVGGQEGYMQPLSACCEHDMFACD